MKQRCMCLRPELSLLITDPVSSVSPQDFSVLSPEHMTARGLGGVQAGLTWTERIGGLISQNMWVSCHWPCFEMKTLRFSSLSDAVRLVRGIELQSAASRLCTWLTQQAEPWPRSLRFALRGSQAPRVHAWSPACGHRGPGSGYQLPQRGCRPLWDEPGAESLGVCI